jgi:hypothetical protein
MDSLGIMNLLNKIEGIADTQLDLTGKISIVCQQMLIGVAQELGVDESKIAKYERDLDNHGKFDFDTLLSYCREKLQGSRSN